MSSDDPAATPNNLPPPTSFRGNSNASNNSVAANNSNMTSSVTDVADSFWEIGQYKRTVRRIDDGLHLCHDLVTMIKERGELESAHAKQLTQWSKKWADLIAKGSEYGTTQNAWRAVLEEAEKKADLHTNMRDRLQNEVQNTIKLWSKEQYRKNTFGHVKESKEAEESFKKAQKAWAKLYAKVDKCKKDYYAACRVERSAINQEKNAQADTSISADQTRKLTEKVEKCGEEVQRAKESYQKALDEINAYNAKYMEDMCQVFERCQEMERKRLKFFKEMLLNVHKCLDISSERSLKAIYDNFYDTVNLADDNQDLKWWSQNCGVGMPMKWPDFEEYTPELRRIGKEPKNREAITLIGTKPTSPHAEYVQRQVSDNSGSSAKGGSQIKSGPNNNAAANGGLRNGPAAAINGGGGGDSGGDSPPTSGEKRTNATEASRGDTTGAVGHKTRETHGRHNNNTSSATGADPNPFEDDWDATPERVLMADDGQPGVPVCALYDYVGQEEDELSFKKGETFDKLKDEDDQGWCTGRKDGKIGLYPANYVELAKT